jgi:hypothetical protein
MATGRRTENNSQYGTRPNIGIHHSYKIILTKMQSGDNLHEFEVCLSYLSACKLTLIDENSKV